MAFMVPEYWYGVMYWCPDTESDYFPGDSFSKQDVADECADGHIDEVDKARGWWARLSAPGYTDATEWSGPFDSENLAREHIEAFYEVDPSTGDELPEDEEPSPHTSARSIHRQAEELQREERSEKGRMIDFFFGKPGSPKRSGLLGLPSWRGRRSSEDQILYETENLYLYRTPKGLEIRLSGSTHSVVVGEPQTIAQAERAMKRMEANIQNLRRMYGVL